MKTIDTLNMSCYRILNNKIDNAISTGIQQIILKNVYGQRYIGRGLTDNIKIQIYGTPGNDMAAYMDGAQLEVFGNGQDSVGNTMNNGRIIIHGNCGDTVGYAMRGGEIYIKYNVGYRVGIHMKEYKNKIPVIVVGGKAGAFLGEYMAGGAIIILGLNRQNNDDSIVGKYCGTGIHGGVIYLNQTNLYNKNLFGKEVLQSNINEADVTFLKQHIDSYKKIFNIKLDIKLDFFRKYIAIGKNPYSNMYCNY
jgi:glutamate synthase domain-containing protein 3